jgi:hypothetical protein
MSAPGSRYHSRFFARVCHETTASTGNHHFFHYIIKDLLKDFSFFLKNIILGDQLLLLNIFGNFDFLITLFSNIVPNCCPLSIILVDLMVTYVASA